MTYGIVCNQPEVIGPWVAKRTGGVWRQGRGSVIGLVKDGEIVAGVLYEDYNGAIVVVHVAAKPEKSPWLCREFLWYAFHYPFEELKCKKIIGYVSSANKKAREFDEGLGFEHEATIKDAHPDGDLLVYSMRPETCRWLKIRGRK